MQVYLAPEIFKFVLTFSKTKTQKSKSICSPLVARHVGFSINKFKEFAVDLDWKKPKKGTKSIEGIDHKGALR